MCACLKPTGYKIFLFYFVPISLSAFDKKNYVCKVHTEFSDSKLHVVCLSRDFQHRFIAIPAIVQVCLLCDYPRLTQCLSLVLSYAFRVVSTVAFASSRTKLVLIQEYGQHLD